MSDRFVNASAHGNWICTSRNVLQTFTNQRLSENSSRRRPITRDIFRLGSDFLN
jgi:hypothetical protein